MNIYRITVREISHIEYEIEAHSQQEAEDFLGGGCQTPKDSTIVDWDIIEIGGDIPSVPLNPCTCDEGFEDHYHCAGCDCILTSYEYDICCWCEERIEKEKEHDNDQT